MKLINKKEMLEELTEVVSVQLKEVLEYYEHLPEELLNRPAKDGGWSIAQCLRHLNTYSAWYLPLIRKSLEKKQPALISPLYEHGFLGRRFIKMMDPVNSKREYKAAKQHIPAPILNAEHTVSAFIDYLKQLLDLLLIAAKTDISKADVPVSIMKWLNLKTGDALKFVIVHNSRHLRQARKNYLIMMTSAVTEGSDQ